MNNPSHNIKQNYEVVKESIQKAAANSGRRNELIRLVVVTKTHPLETILAAIEAGVRDFGENYAEEATKKINAISRQGLTWHMIGHVQSRKAELVAKNFDLVHSVDSLRLATRLDHFCKEADRRLPILIECNVSGEQSKFGYAAYQPLFWPTLFEEIEKIAQLPNLEIQGLMTMPPLFNNSEQTRPFFRNLFLLRNQLAKQFPGCNWKELSMGTSADYLAAVEEGATIVRVGTAILGSRTEKK